MSGYLVDKKGLKERLSCFAKPTAKKLAEEAGMKLGIKYLSLIADFYADLPHPSKYKRTWNLFRSAETYRPDKRNTIYYGGFKVSAAKMND